MSHLCRFTFRTSPFLSGIAGAFDERKSRNCRESFEILNGEDHRLSHESVDEQLVCSRMNQGNPIVVPFKMQSGGSHNSMKMLMGLSATVAPT